MSNSSLVDYTKISPNKTENRNHKIDTITPHCVVGQVSVESLGALFAQRSRKASSNYGIGYDGRIGMYVEEKDRSWCSSSESNDQRAITIEIASDTADPYKITDAAYKATVRLCADICKRNRIPELRWKADKSLIGKVDQQNITVHRWFAAKACPGDYIYNRLGNIANEVNAILKNGTVEKDPVDQNNSVTTGYPPVPFVVHVLIDDLNYRAAPSMKGPVVGQVLKGYYTIVEMSEGWGRLKSDVGWIWLGNRDYCEIQNGVSQRDFLVEIPEKVTNLNIRYGPGKNFPKTGNYAAPGYYTIVETSSGTGSVTGWGKLKSGAGWISLDYATKITGE